MKTKNCVLITGAGGLIGLELTKQLLDLGVKVIAVDSFINSALNTFPTHENLMLYTKDIRNIRAIDKIFKSNPGINAVIHLAAVHFIPYCDTHPHETIDVNVRGTQNILEVMEKYKVKRLLFASTAAVYKPQSTPHNELDDIEPVDIYGDSKYMCEQLIKGNAAKTKIKYTILRLFNVYGYGDANAHLIPDLLDQVIKTNQIHIGNHSSLRDYISKYDVARAFVLALSNNKSNNQIYNVGHETPYSAQDIFNMLADLFRLYHNKELILNINAESLLRVIDRPHLVSDTRKVRFELQWQPQFTLQDFLEEWAKGAYVTTRDI